MIENNIMSQGEKTGGHLPDQILDPVIVCLKMFTGGISPIQPDHPFIMAEQNRGMISFQRFREGCFTCSNETAKQVQGRHNDPGGELTGCQIEIPEYLAQSDWVGGASLWAVSI